MELIKLSLICFYISSVEVFAFPVNSDPRFVLVPLSLPNFNQKPRGPLDFIGNWIQSSNFFPVEVNVPDTFSAIGSTLGGWANNVGNFAQNVGTTVGTTVQGFTQNVGSGIQNFAQGLTQRVPFLAAIVRPTAGSAQRFVILIPAQEATDFNEINQNFKPNVDYNLNQELLEIFP